MKAILINAVAGCLALYIGASVHGSYTYTPLDVPGASYTYAYGIDGSNIVGYYIDGISHGFRATLGAPVPRPAAAWMALPLLGVMCAIGNEVVSQCLASPSVTKYSKHSPPFLPSAGYVTINNFI